ncbi:MAG: hypothetical protein CMC13_11970 [Flavobacteriaceae bacterium]|nr:hypothetical protein [Flavobacteriaceae bacterium]|tara:strand:- start:107923 stop:108213 length:291 start_codon:yes stop_codon:yes gene_type:complete
MKTLKKIVLVGAIAAMCTSCYVQTHVVGSGAKGNTEVKSWNHYLLYGLAPVGVSQPEEMANGAKDYTVTTKHSFVNGLINSLTFGIYSPTTTIVKY